MLTNQDRQAQKLHGRNSEHHHRQMVHLAADPRSAPVTTLASQRHHGPNRHLKIDRVFVTTPGLGRRMRNYRAAALLHTIPCSSHPLMPFRSCAGPRRDPQSDGGESAISSETTGHAVRFGLDSVVSQYGYTAERHPPMLGSLFAASAGVRFLREGFAKLILPWRPPS